MILIRNDGTGRLYALDTGYICWLTTNQYADFRAAGFGYTALPETEFGPMLGAFNVPINKVPTINGTKWHILDDMKAELFAIMLRYRDDIIAKIDATHTP